ncbi:MAG: ATP synthase subunit B [Thermodesulfovibrionales bacterium]
MSVFDIVRNAMLAGLGMQQKAKEFVDDLVKKGELSESQGAKLVKEWSDKVEKNADDMTRNLSELIQKTIETMKFASHEDIKRLTQKVDDLSERLQKLEGSKGGQ